MCGIVGVVVERNVVEILLEGLKRLEYRGYDLVGVVLLDKDGNLKCICKIGKVKNLVEVVESEIVLGIIGIVYIWWVMYGGVMEYNVYLYFFLSCVVVVYNGIIENYVLLCKNFFEKGYIFLSDIDIEIIVYVVYEMFNDGKFLLEVV